MAIALENLKREKRIERAFVLDIDLHFGDGTVNIFKGSTYVQIFNGSHNARKGYLREIEQALEEQQSSIIGISAGFDNHKDDWGGVLETDDYATIGKMVRERCEGEQCGCFALLEGAIIIRSWATTYWRFCTAWKGGNDPAFGDVSFPLCFDFVNENR
jgi:acetoin utilization deacetylase AcuC-like enzyme